MQGNNTEFHGRQRLRPWLISQINSRKFPGLEWVNHDELMFKVPWKHGGKQDWSANNSLIFKEWAVHTGKHREGVDKDDWPVWKTRFRCAMNKLPDIQEMKDLSHLDGDDPYRVYKFLPIVRNNSTGINVDMSNRMICTNMCVQKAPSIQENKIPMNLSVKSCIPQTVQEIGSMEQDECKHLSLTSDLGDIDMQELVGVELQDGHLMIDDKSYPTNTSTGAPIYNGQSQFNILKEITRAQLEPAPSDHEITVEIRFRENIVASHNITNVHGVRLYYEQGLPSNDQFMTVYGSDYAQPIPFPSADAFPIQHHEQQSYTDKLLNCLDRGLTIECHNGDIYAIRKCRVVVFASSPGSLAPIKLSRTTPKTKIFDYQQFKIDLQNYANCQGSKPSAQILLGFGQNWCNSLQPYQNLLISATVYHRKAIYDLSKVASTRMLSPGIQISESDEVDRYIKIYKSLKFSLANEIPS